MLPVHTDPHEWRVPIFMEHVVVRSHSHERTCPITLYLDATPYSVFDSLYAMYMQVSWARNRQGRVLLWRVQKSRLCRCGCSSACTFDALSNIRIWHLNLGLEGKLPACKHNGSPWDDLDQKRRNRGCSLGFFVAVLQFRGDR